MRKPEQLLWDAMKRNLPKSLDLQRVENMVGDGMPDVYVGASGKWVELKVPPHIPARASTPLLGAKYGLRLSQKNWLMKYNSFHKDQKSSAFILTRLPGGELLMASSQWVSSINLRSLQEWRAISCASHWSEIAEALA